MTEQSELDNLNQTLHAMQKRLGETEALNRDLTSQNGEMKV